MPCTDHLRTPTAHPVRVDAERTIRLDDPCVVCGLTTGGTIHTNCAAHPGARCEDHEYTNEEDADGMVL